MSRDILELLADQATGDLSVDDAAALTALDVDESMEMAAAAATLAMLGEIEEMPADLRSRVETAGVRQVEPPVVQLRSGRSPWAWSGWVAAAAMMLLAVSSWVLLSPPFADYAPQALRQQLMQEGEDVKLASWSDWDQPEIEGVTGDVVWSESEQRGFLRLAGLPPLEADEQYQLWIIDERGLADANGQSARISGAVFDSYSTGETIVPVYPAIPVRGAAAFAVTIEDRGGVWASDMSRRVVIASLDP